MRFLHWPENLVGFHNDHGETEHHRWNPVPFIVDDCGQILHSSQGITICHLQWSRCIWRSTSIIYHWHLSTNYGKRTASLHLHADSELKFRSTIIVRCVDRFVDFDWCSTHASKTFLPINQSFEIQVLRSGTRWSRSEARPGQQSVAFWKQSHVKPASLQVMNCDVVSCSVAGWNELKLETPASFDSLPIVDPDLFGLGLPKTNQKTWSLIPSCVCEPWNHWQILCAISSPCKRHQNLWCWNFYTCTVSHTCQISPIFATFFSSKDFILATVLTAYSSRCHMEEAWWDRDSWIFDMFYVAPPCQDLQFIEFYAGKARATQCMRSAGLRAAKFDYIYFGDKGMSGNNYYDILTDAGFSYLAIDFLDGGTIFWKTSLL